MPDEARRVEPAGSHLRVTIGDVTIAMASRESQLRISARGPHLRFVSRDRRTPDIRVDVAWDDAPGRVPASGEKLFDSGGVWHLFRQADLLSFHLSSPKFGSVPYARATVDKAFASGVVYLRRDCFDPSADIYPLDYPLDELLVTNWLALGRGVEVHACGVVDHDGAGYLFAGYSGAGKTTMARIWRHLPGVTVLSDDRIILRQIDDEIWMHGTPWHGDEPLASPGRAVLRRLFVLRHAPSNHIARLAGADAVTQLFSRSFPPFFSAQRLERILSLLSDITAKTPVYDLGFVPDSAIPEFVRRAG